MKQVNYREAIIKVLHEAEHPMSTNEIWKVVIEKKYLDVTTIQGKTPEATMASLLYREVKKGTVNNIKTVFGATETTPKRYYLLKN
ncbi:MAG: winged helix-turn-helix domain-containing protein [Lachnospiraceae bacterium]|nr:winged helix-turn-helix domain-containing protein [Lachnospiraceae bacterium]